MDLLSEITLGARFLRFFGLAKIGEKAAKGGEEVVKVAKGAKGAQNVAKAAGDGMRALKLGLLGGATTFFGFSWLTNGGLVRSVAGTLGIDNTAASILVIVVVFAVVGIILYGLYKWVSSRAASKGGRRR